MTAKSSLNRSILEQGWSAFRRQLECKQGRRGGLMVVKQEPTEATMQELALVERAGIFAFTALARQPKAEGEDVKCMRCFMEAR